MFWFSATLHLFSSGQVVRNDCNTDCCSYDLKLGKVNCDNCCGYSIHYTPHISIAILFHLFGCYWATQFILACSSTVVAGSVASYYWVRREISVSTWKSEIYWIASHKNSPCLVSFFCRFSLCIFSLADHSSNFIAAWYTISHCSLFTEATDALQPWICCSGFTCCICCWMGAVYTRMPSSQVEASWFCPRELLWKSDVLLFWMLPGLHRLDPQVSKSKCLHYGQYEDLVHTSSSRPTSSECNYWKLYAWSDG